jgi:hypothetical protein
MRKLGYVLALGCLLAGANGAFGGITAVGDPIPTDSWAQGFYETDVGLFDEMVIQMQSGGPFQTTAFTNFSEPGWTNVGGADTAWAVGGNSTYVVFNINFEGSSSSPLVFEFWALRNGVVVEDTRVFWNPGWSYALGLNNPAPSLPVPDPLETGVPVPEPLTMASAFFAIAGLGGYIRRRTGRAVA